MNELLPKKLGDHASESNEIVTVNTVSEPVRLGRFYYALVEFDPKSRNLPAIHPDFYDLTHLQKTAEVARYWVAEASYRVDRKGYLRAWWKLWFVWFLAVVPVSVFCIACAALLAIFFGVAAQAADYLSLMMQSGCSAFPIFLADNDCDSRCYGSNRGAVHEDKVSIPAFAGMTKWRVRENIAKTIACVRISPARDGLFVAEGKTYSSQPSVW